MYIYMRHFSDQIRVNAVNPTVVMTDLGKLGWSDPKKAGPMLARIPLGRFAGNTCHTQFRKQNRTAAVICRPLSVIIYNIEHRKNQI